MIKLIKRISLLAFVFGSLFACQQDSILPETQELQDIAITDLPEAVIFFLNDHYDLSEVSHARRHRRGSDDDLFEARFRYGSDLYFDVDGRLRGSRDDDDSYDVYISWNDLPQNIRDFIEANYSQAVLEIEINYHRDGSFSFEIELDNDWEIYFDQEGNIFLEDRSGGRRRGRGEHVAISSLPAGIEAYVQANYPGAQIVKAEIKYNEDGSFRKYEIELSNQLELYFTESGEILLDDSPSGSGFDDSVDIPISDLPQNVKDYIGDNYPGLSMTRAKKKLNDDGSIKGYEVRLSDKDKTKVFFDAEGNFTGSDD